MLIIGLDTVQCLVGWSQELRPVSSRLVGRDSGKASFGKSNKCAELTMAVHVSDLCTLHRYNLLIQ